METEVNFLQSLERMAMVKIVTCLYRRQSVTQHIKQFFMYGHISEFHLPMLQYVTDRHQKDDWGVIINLVKGMEMEVIPMALRSPLKYLIEQMGMRIFEYLREMTARLLKNSTPHKYARNIEYYIDNIMWTSTGAINQIAIFMKRYADERIENDYFMWHEACHYCLEKLAKELWMVVPVESKQRIKSKANTRIDGDVCLAIYWHSELSGDSDMKQKLYLNTYGMVHRILHRRDSIDAVMFKICVHQENDHAAQFFWERLNAEDRTKQAVNGCEIVLERRCAFPYCFATYCKRCVDMFCSLLFKMGLKERNQLFVNEFEKTYDPFNTWILLLNWPWEDLFITTLEKAWKCFSIFDCKFFINKFETTVYTADRNYSLTETSSFHKSILYKVCVNSPRHLKPHFTSRYRQLALFQTQLQKRPRVHFKSHKYRLLSQ